LQQKYVEQMSDFFVEHRYFKSQFLCQFNIAKKARS